MKLLYFIPALYNHGGMERVLTQKVNSLVEDFDYEVIIVTTDQMANPSFFKLSERVELIHLDLDFNTHYNKSILIKTIIHFRKLKRYRIKIQAIIKEKVPDVIISLGGKELDFLYRIKTKIPRICEMHFSMNIRKQFILSRKNGIIWSLIGNIRTNQLKKATKKLDKLIVLTNQDKVQWEKTHKNIIHIPNPIPFEINSNSAVSDNKTVIAVGRLDAQKGYDQLIESWCKVAIKHPDWTLNIYGSGELEQKIKSQIEKLELNDVVHLKGVTHAIEKEYYTSSFFVMSSLYEGLPMVLLEAMACGLPIVSYDCEWGPRELIEDGYNGFLVPVGDSTELANKICCLIESRELRVEMSHNSKDIAKRYSMSEIMKSWDLLFNDLKKI